MRLPWMLGGYIYFWISQSLGMPKLVGMLAAAVLGALFGIAKY